jgi:hypothetical protein
MKLIQQPMLLACCAALLVAGSCKKPDNTSGSIETVTTNSDISTFDALRSTPQTFTVTAGTAKSLLGAAGTYLRFYPNSFKDKNGNIITSGTINLELIEAYEIGDMIANRAATVTNTGVLTSGGEVNIKATMNGEEVFANKYGIGFKAAQTATAKPMELYYGDRNNPDSIVIWSAKPGAKDDTVSGTTYLTDPSLKLIEGIFYMFDSCSSFKWINSDHPHDGTSKYVKITVNVSGLQFTGNVQSSLSIGFAALKVATTLRQTSFDQNTRTGTYQGWSPTGSPARFAFFVPKDKNNWYYYEYTGTVTDGLVINATPQLLTLAGMKSKLKDLGTP